MANRVNRDTLVDLVSQRSGEDVEIVGIIVDAFLDEIYQSIKRGEGVTLKNFGSFYMRPERESWVFKFNPSQKWRAVFGWSSTYNGEK